MKPSSDASSAGIYTYKYYEVPSQNQPVILIKPRCVCRIMVSLPSIESREMILRTLLAKEKVETLDFKELAVMTEGYSGSDLKVHQHFLFLFFFWEKLNQPTFDICIHLSMRLNYFFGNRICASRLRIGLLGNYCNKRGKRKR